LYSQDHSVISRAVELGIVEFASKELEGSSFKAHLEFTQDACRICDTYLSCKRNERIVLLQYQLGTANHQHLQD
jgi:hypothetical protein